MAIQKSLAIYREAFLLTNSIMYIILPKNHDLEALLKYALTVIATGLFVCLLASPAHAIMWGCEDGIPCLLEQEELLSCESTSCLYWSTAYQQQYPNVEDVVWCYEWQEALCSYETFCSVHKQLQAIQEGTYDCIGQCISGDTTSTNHLL